MRQIYKTDEKFLATEEQIYKLQKFFLGSDENWILKLYFNELQKTYSAKILRKGFVKEKVSFFENIEFKSEAKAIDFSKNSFRELVSAFCLAWTYEKIIDIKSLFDNYISDEFVNEKSKNIAKEFLEIVKK